MNQTKSSNPSTSVGIVSAMRPIWRIGIPATAALSTVLAVIFALALDGCSNSKGSKTEVSSSPRAGLPPGATSGPESATQQDSPIRPARPANKSKVEHRWAAAIYSNGKYGISFLYPRNYSLVTPERAALTQSLEKVPMNFIKPGGVNLATVALPNGPVTSLFHVNVDKQLTAQTCQQFAVPDSHPGGANRKPVPVKVRLRGVDFTRMENGSERNDLRYYHHFENGACYEFVMAVQEKDGSPKPVDHFELFDQLERIMSTVKINPATVTAELPQAPAPSGNTR
jgi:hypothetical protein